METSGGVQFLNCFAVKVENKIYGINFTIYIVELLGTLVYNILNLTAQKYLCKNVQFAGL